MRLIDADALKTPIEDRIDNIPASEYDNGWNNAIYAVIDEIDNAPTVETKKLEHKAYNEGFKDGVEQGIKLSEGLQGKWIPVSERLPEEKTKVLITNDKGEVDLIRWDTWWQNQTVYPNHIRAIAWQPLPEPYKEGGAK
jgi:hypothetical protein